MREGPELLQAKSTRARGREGMFFLDAEGVRVLGGHAVWGSRMRLGHVFPAGAGILEWK